MSNVGSPQLWLAQVSGYPSGTYYSAYLSWVDDAGSDNYFYPDLVISEEWSEGATVTEHPVEQGANVADHVRVELVKCELVIFVSNEPIGANNWDSPNVGGLAATAKTWNNNLAAGASIRAGGGFLGAATGGGVIGNAVGAAAGQVAAGLLTQGFEQDVTVAAPVQNFQEFVDYVYITIALLSFLKSTAQQISLIGSKQVISPMVIEELSVMRGQDEGTGATITIGLKEVRIVQTQLTTAPLPSIPSATTPTKAGQQNSADGTTEQQNSVLKTWENGAAGLWNQALSGVKSALGGAPGTGGGI